MLLTKLASALVGVSMLTMAACGGDGSTSTDPNQPGSTHAALNVVNGCTDGAVDVYLNGKLSGTTEYRKATGFINVDVGNVKVEIRAKGDAQTSAALATSDLKLDASTKLSVAIVGRINAAGNAEANAAASSKPQLVTLTSGAADSSAVKLRVLHASPSAASIDLAADSQAVASAVAYGKVSDYAKLSNDLLPGIKLGLRLSGQTVDSASAANIAQQGKGSVLTAIAFGETLPTCADDKFLNVSLLNENTGELKDLDLQINSSGPKSSFYIFHGSEDLGSLDGAVRGSAALFANLAYQKASPILQVNPGVLALELRNAGTSTVAYASNLKLLPGTSWSTSISGLQNFATHSAAKLTLSSATRLGANIGAYARVVNSTVDVAALDLYSGATAWGKGVGFAQAGAYVQLAAGLQPGTLNLKSTATAQALLNASISAAVLVLCQNQVVTYYVTGASDTSLNKPLTMVAVVEFELSSAPLACANLSNQ